MQRKRTDTSPDYKPEDLRNNAQTIEGSISRIQNTIDRLMEENLQYKTRISENNKQIQIFSTEVARLEQNKAQLVSLANRIERQNAKLQL